MFGFDAYHHAASNSGGVMNVQETMDKLKRDPDGVAAEAADRFRQTGGVGNCDVMLIAGTGWNRAIDALGR